MKPTTVAKKIIQKELDKRGLSYTRLTARTISFTDLARTSVVFVKIHGWESNPAWSKLQAVARQNGFRIEAG